jgi:Fur family ferric uptake transcriptional regulator
MKFNINNKKEKVLKSYLRKKGFRLTEQRKIIVNHFCSKEKHYSVEELYNDLKGVMPHIGHATVYRTMQLLVDAGLASERRFKDNITRYEPVHRSAQHGHMICLECGKIIEFEYRKIEQLQLEAARRHGFKPLSHKLELYGYCEKCARTMKKRKKQ